MHHQYTSRSLLEGAWLSEDSPPFVHCRWWWEQREGVLRVMFGREIRSWSPPKVSPDIEHRLIEDFPEIAYDITRRF